ncbi:MAG TPA: chloride channel protein, partial [Acetobacteraceae bacterium]
MGQFPATGFLDWIGRVGVFAPRGRGAASAALLREGQAGPVPTPPDEAGRLRARRHLGEWVLHAPHTLRALVRTDEIWLVVLSALVGVAAGLCVTFMTLVTLQIHRVLFQLGPHERLSGQVEVDPWSALLVPCIGGLLVGLLGLAVVRWWPKQTVDPIEANALYGGRMSVNDSLIVVGQTMLSNSVGASVGLEAGYTQIGAALASRLGRSFRVRRNDLRLLVGCGAAGAIAAAFNAPLTGAFYAFELVIGTYSLATLAPVVGSAICAVAVVRVLIPHEYGFDIRVPTAIETIDYLPILAMGMICALVGIAIMR